MELPRHSRLGTLSEYEEEGCYQVDVDIHTLAIKTAKAMTIGHSQSKNPLRHLESKLVNGITIYGEEPTAEALGRVAGSYPEL